MEATIMRVKNKYFSITPDVVEKMKEADINPDILRQRLASGWKFEDAIEAPIGVRRSEWDSLKPKENDIASYKERMEQRRLQELKRKKPHYLQCLKNTLVVNGASILWRMTYSLERWLDHEH